MQTRRSALVNVLLIAAVALSGLMVNVPAEVPSRDAQSSPSMLNSALAAKGKHNHHRDRKQADRKHDRKSSRHKQDKNGPAAQPSPAAREGDWQDYCDEKLIQLNRNELCTHGADSAAQFDLDKDTGKNDEKVAAAAAQDSAETACDGDGQTGFRVQALYVRGTSGTPLTPAVKEQLRTYLVEADQIFQQGATETGGLRNIRFVQESAGDCRAKVDEVVLSTSAVGDFNSMINALQNAPLNRNRTDRIYLAFADASRYCGIGTIWSDDRASSNNWNNAGPSYSRVDRTCWSGDVAAHELTHNLGGVQDSAPNTSHGYHCIDEYDVMCYSDSPNHPQMHYVCPESAAYPGMETLDCHHDDYYNANPAPGSYLDTCWNSANNQFLIGARALPSEAAPCIASAPTDFSAPSVSLTVPGSSGPQREVSLSASASDNGSVNSVTFGVCAGATCDWSTAQSLGGVATAPYSVSWKAPKRGTFTFLAQATDVSGNTALSSPATLRVNAKSKSSKHKGGHKGRHKN